MDGVYLQIEVRDMNKKYETSFRQEKLTKKSQSNEIKCAFYNNLYIS